MIQTDDNHVLFIEPRLPAATEPLKDTLTENMREAMEHSRPSDYVYFGLHKCVCGAMSDASDWILPTGQTTNSLAVHYLEYHRDEVPKAELEKVRLICDEVEKLRPAWVEEAEIMRERSDKSAERLARGSCDTCGTSFFGAAESYCPFCGGVVCLCGHCFCN